MLVLDFEVSWLQGGFLEKIMVMKNFILRGGICLLVWCWVGVLWMCFQIRLVRVLWLNGLMLLICFLWIFIVYFGFISSVWFIVIRLNLFLFRCFIRLLMFVGCVILLVLLKNCRNLLLFRLMLFMVMVGLLVSLWVQLVRLSFEFLNLGIQKWWVEQWKMLMLVFISGVRNLCRFFGVFIRCVEQFCCFYWEKWKMIGKFVLIVVCIVCISLMVKCE